MKNRILRAATLLVALLMLFPMLASCANRGTPMLTLSVEGKTYSYSKNLYELQLSIAKGALAAGGKTINGHTAIKNAFWDAIDEIDGKVQKMDDYYKAAVLEECRHILIGLYLFDYYGLSLSETEKDELADYLNEFIMTDGEGSKNKLNSVLSEYGINYEMLEEHCTNSAKLKKVREHIYSLLGHNIKENHLKNNYVHFEQIFLANSTEVFVTDENGDDVYYNKSDKTVCYKVTEHFEIKNGAKIYYTTAEKKHISYDTEKGVRFNKTDENGNVIFDEMTESELQALQARAELIYGQLSGASYTDFVAMMDKETEGDIPKDGCYLNKNDAEYFAKSENTLYLAEIIEKLDKANVGDVILVKSTQGYHILMKLAPTERAYELEENKDWFASSLGTGFENTLTEEAFRNECKKYYDMIQLDEKVYAETPNMKQINPNYYFY